MKKVISLFVIVLLSLTISIGCSSSNQKSEEQLKAEIKAEMEAEAKLKEELKKEVKAEVEAEKSNTEGSKDKIKDIDAVIEFVSKTPTNKMTDNLGKKLIVLKNYETHYFDFTGEGNDDIAIVTWGDNNNNSYLPVIFVTTDILQNEYSLINSDFRASKGSEFFTEDGFIIKNDKENKSYAYDIAYNINNEFIGMATRYIGHGEEIYTIQSGTDIRYVVKNALEKLDGFKKFNVNQTYTYFDEKGNTHKYEDTTRSYTFNNNTREYEIVEKQNMESIPLEKIIAENFIVGNDNTLKTFEDVYNENDLETAINYYYEHRQKFSKKTRIKYIEDYSKLVDGTLNISRHSDINWTSEVVTDDVISSVTVNIKPIPEKISSVISVVKRFSIEDGANFPKNIDKDGWYTVTCINSNMTKKINLMVFDKEILTDGERSYGRTTNGFVNVEFKTQQQMLEAIKDIDDYPTVLINNLQQLNEFKHKDIWKTNIVIVPEKIVFKP
ncbi:MAG: hypothetical protein VR72_09585 [Clostridiaceae bacterium BRH_c20a]|nr:MAG: hypothetical protein VR72_09585 [Clostridiaceae bacterium BRH_c20a]